MRNRNQILHSNYKLDENTKKITGSTKPACPDQKLFVTRKRYLTILFVITLCSDKMFFTNFYVPYTDVLPYVRLYDTYSICKNKVRIVRRPTVELNSKIETLSYFLNE